MAHRGCIAWPPRRNNKAKRWLGFYLGERGNKDRCLMVCKLSQTICVIVLMFKRLWLMPSQRKGRQWTFAAKQWSTHQILSLDDSNLTLTSSVTVIQHKSWGSQVKCDTVWGRQAPARASYGIFLWNPWDRPRILYIGCIRQFLIPHPAICCTFSAIFSSSSHVQKWKLRV